MRTFNLFLITLLFNTAFKFCTSKYLLVEIEKEEHKGKPTI